MWAACGAPEIRTGESTFGRVTRRGLLTEEEARDGGLGGGEKAQGRRHFTRGGKAWTKRSKLKKHTAVGIASS